MSKYRACFAAVAVFSTVSLAIPGVVAGQGRGQGPAKKAEKAEKHEKHENKAEKKADKKADKSHTARAVVVDRDGHIRVIRDYANGGSLPPGLAKREALPPGLREQMRENGTLP